MIKKLLIPLELSILILATFALFSPHLALDPRTHGPRIKNRNGTSTNWSGYANYNGTASDVKGSWVVPSSLNCTSTNTYSSAWVGLDGYNDNTVEQTGTEHDCSGGIGRYYAWYEMYPKPSYILPLTISAGDTINSEVRFLGGGRFQLTLTDISSGKTFSTIQRSNKAFLQSAEWIMEAPWNGGVLPLANFGTIGYSGSNATLNGNPGSISAFQFDPITMANSNGTVKAVPSTLSPDGTSFSVTWKSN